MCSSDLDEELHARPSAGANSIGFEAWHVFRTVDNIVRYVFLREQTVWLAQGLDAAWGLPKAAQFQDIQEFTVFSYEGVRTAFTDPARPTLVGFKPVVVDARPGGGAHLFAPDAPRDMAHDLGHLTTVTFSPAMGQWLALGLLANGRERIGQRVVAHDPVRGRDRAAQIVDAVIRLVGDGR